MWTNLKPLQNKLKREILQAVDEINKTEKVEVVVCLISFFRVKIKYMLNKIKEEIKILFQIWISIL